MQYSRPYHSREVVGQLDCLWLRLRHPVLQVAPAGRDSWNSSATVIRHQLLHQFPLIREGTRFKFRIHEVAVNHHVEYPPSLRDQPRLLAKGFPDSSSQTDCLRFIVSLRAIDNRNIHIHSHLLDFQGTRPVLPWQLNPLLPYFRTESPLWLRHGMCLWLKYLH